MTDTPCFSSGTEKLPSSVYFNNQSLLICRGTPTEMVLEMVGSSSPMTVREALQHLVKHISETRDIHIELPWKAPDEILCNLFIQVLLGTGIISPTPLS